MIKGEGQTHSNKRLLLQQWVGLRIDRWRRAMSNFLNYLKRWNKSLYRLVDEDIDAFSEDKELLISYS